MKDNCLKPKKPCGCPPDGIPVPRVEPTPKCFCPKRRCEEPMVFFRTQIIPASMGTSAEGQPFAPENGRYYNMLVRYEADGAVFLYDSAGVYTNLKEATE